MSYLDERRLAAVVIPPLDGYEELAMPVSKWITQAKDHFERMRRIRLFARVDALTSMAISRLHFSGDHRHEPVVYYCPIEDGPMFLSKLDNNGTTILVGYHPQRVEDAYDDVLWEGSPPPPVRSPPVTTERDFDKLRKFAALPSTPKASP